MASLRDYARDMTCLRGQLRVFRKQTDGGCAVFPDCLRVFFGVAKRKWRWKMKLKRTSYFSLVSTLFRSDPYHYTIGGIESLSDRAASLFLSHFPRGEIGLLFFLNRYKQFGVIWCPCTQ